MLYIAGDCASKRPTATLTIDAGWLQVVLIYAWCPHIIIVMCHLMMGICSEKCIITWFHRHANTVECAYPDLGGRAHCTPMLYGVAYLLLGYKPVQHVAVLNAVNRWNVLCYNAATAMMSLGSPGNRKFSAPLYFGGTTIVYVVYPWLKLLRGTWLYSRATSHSPSVLVWMISDIVTYNLGNFDLNLCMPSFIHCSFLLDQGNICSAPTVCQALC